MKEILIIGGGFSGTMTAVHLIQQATKAFELTIINPKRNFNRGVAFNPYSKKHLLNVIALKMSAFKKESNHFLGWVMRQPAYCNKDRNLIANAFLSRELYGTYLEDIWQEAVLAGKQKNLRVTVVDALVTNLCLSGELVTVITDKGEKLSGDFAIVATGNHAPGHPKVDNVSFFDSSRYYQNPWQINTVSDVEDQLPVLIIGSGLTMVDTVIGLQENGFHGKIFSLSPKGFNVLPHRHNGLVYTKLTDELPPSPTLYEIVMLVNRHVKELRNFGVSPEPLIDSLRVYTQQIWAGLPVEERKNLWQDSGICGEWRVIAFQLTCTTRCNSFALMES